MAKYYKSVCNIDDVGLMQDIEDSLLHFCDTEDESIDNLLLYAQDYYDEADFMVAQNGCLLSYYSDVCNLYREHGFANIDEKPMNIVWETYRRDVGVAVIRLLKRRGYMRHRG